MSLLSYEAQRSGKLPRNQRVQWRGDSGLKDGRANDLDLIGAYYDAGDILKLRFPMAFTITMLSWWTLEFRNHLKVKNEIINALNAIKWGTDYLIKAHPQPDILYGEIGDCDSDNECWERPEDMTTPRTVYRIDDQHSGSDLAAETAAALAAASISFRWANPKYSSLLLAHAEQLFNSARDHPGLSQNSIPEAVKTYASSGYEDEMMWLHRAAKNQMYLNLLETQKIQAAPELHSHGMTNSWHKSWLQSFFWKANLVVQMYGGITRTKRRSSYALAFKKRTTMSKKTPGGLLRFLPWNNIQYVATATFVTTVYCNYLIANKHTTLACPTGIVKPYDLRKSIWSQVDYILGVNPKNMSYMVGIGSNFPKKIHHRGASIVSIKKHPTPVTCKGGYEKWFNINEPNPNVLDGAPVSPDENDGYTDDRSNYLFAEPTTVTNAPLAGVFAQFSFVK